MTELYIFVQKYFSSFIYLFLSSNVRLCVSYFLVSAPFYLDLVHSSVLTCVLVRIFLHLLSFLLTFCVSLVYFWSEAAVCRNWMFQYGIALFSLYIFFCIRLLSVIVDMYYYACLFVCMPGSLEKSTYALGVHLR